MRAPTKSRESDCSTGFSNSQVSRSVKSGSMGWKVWGEDAAGQVTPVGGLRSETGDHFGFRQGGHLG